MFLSILCMFLAVITAAGIILYPKCNNKMNGTKAIIVAVMALSCYLSLAGVLSIQVQQRVSLGFNLIFLLISGGILWLGIYKKKKVQTLFWRLSDVVGILIVIIFVLGIAFHVFSPSLSLQYKDAIGAEQFQESMRLLRNSGEMNSVSFHSYIGALFIEVCAPFVTAAKYYKAFMIAEIFMRILEACMFYIVILTISDRKLLRYAAPVLCICYFFGYPAISLLQANYGYWNAGALLIVSVVYALLLIEKRSDMKWYSSSLLSLFVITGWCCIRPYSMFCFAGISASLIGLWFSRRKSIMDKKIKYGSIVILIMAEILAFFLFYQEFFVVLREAEVSATESVGIYRSMYGDLLFFLPVFFFVFVYIFFKKKSFVSVGILGTCMLIGTIILYILWYHFLLDSFFYFLNYYQLWAIGWILAAIALEFIAETKQYPIFLSYTGMLLLIGFLTLSNYDYKMWHRNANYNQPGTTKNFFSLYRQSMDGILTDYEEYKVSNDILAAFDYAAEAGDLENTAIVTSNEALQYWNDAFTGSESDDYRLDKAEFAAIIRRLSDSKTDAVVVIKENGEYSGYFEYYQRCQVLFENDAAVVLTFAGENWNDIEGMNPDYSVEKLNLFNYVKQNYGTIVPLMAAKTAYMDFIVYQNIVKTDRKEFYTWYYNPVENIDHLNETETAYVLLLKDDSYYQENKRYYNEQEILYENEAGMIITYKGNAWSTEYGE